MPLLLLMMLPAAADAAAVAATADDDFDAVDGTLMMLFVAGTLGGSVVVWAWLNYPPSGTIHRF